jgi:hypothetical protein
MKERSAARKRAEKAVGAALAGEQRAYPVDSTPDCGQVCWSGVLSLAGFLAWDCMLLHLEECFLNILP